MPRLNGALGLALGALTVLPNPAWAVSDADLAKIQQQIQSLKSDYEKRIHDLEQRLARAEKDAQTAKDSAIQAKDSAAQAKDTAAQASAAVENAPAASAAAAAPAIPASAGAFNPGIAGILNGQFGGYSQDPAKRRIPGFQTGPDAKQGPRGFSLGESEIALSADVDPFFTANLNLSFTRENEVSVEEGYIQSTGLPWGFTAKAGRFFSGIGYLNEKHAHDWDFIDAPLPYRALLNTQYGDDGVQIRWLAPTPFFVELGVEGFRGDAWPANGSVHGGVGAGSAFIHAGDDFNDSSSWLAGLSFLRTGARDRTDDLGDSFTGNDNVAIASLVYKWAPDGNPVDRNLIVNGEYFRGLEQGTLNGAGFDQTRSGWYLQGVYQFMPQWRVGLRYDEVSAGSIPANLFGTSIDAAGFTPRAATALLEYDTSEFGRFRLQYSYDRSDRKVSHDIVLGYTIIIGPHGAHRF